MGNPTHCLKFAVIGEDPIGRLEVQISASTKKFSGIIDLLLEIRDLNEFLKKMKGFPISLDSPSIRYQAKNLSLFSLEFCVTSIGSVYAVMEMKELIYSLQSGQLEMRIEPASIDIFHQQLSTLIKCRKGEAALRGY